MAQKEDLSANIQILPRWKRPARMEYMRQYYERHKVKMVSKTQFYRLLRPEYYSDYAKKFRKSRRESILLAMGGSCIQCGFDDLRALHIDHINGGGNKHRKSLNGASTTYYRNLLKELEADSIQFAKKYQLLCANCNGIKMHENSEWSKGIKNTYGK